MTEASLWSKHPYDVTLTPAASEKSARLEDEDKYVFFVDPRTSKTEIKQTVETIFDVKATSMSARNRQGKARRTRNGAGRRKNTRRAIISLREGSIDIYGGAIGWPERLRVGIHGNS